MKRLAIISTHPIQYNYPLYKSLAERNNIAVKVFYTWGEQSISPKFDPGFGKKIEWDIPLLNGYPYEFLENVAKDPGSHHFFGVINPEIIRKVNVFKPDSLLIYGWAFSSHLKVIRYFSGKVPIFFRGDSTFLTQQNGLKSLARKLFLRWIYSHVDKALYVGTHNLRYYQAAGLKESELVYAPHVVDNVRFDQDEIEATKNALQIRKKLNIPDGAFVFLFAGKFQPVKDPLILLNAFINAGLASSTHLLFVGNGELESDMKVRAQSVPSVHFMEFANQSEMPSVYRLGNFFVLPSKGPETWGLAVNEAMACKRPVIVSDQCGCAVDLVEEGKNGFIFKGSSEGSLAEKLLLAFENRNSLNEMGMMAYEKVMQNSIEGVARIVEDLVIGDLN